ncbi:hypothetical protein L7F22_062662 [Adiantum nelumboides]|nr:hypothetical protein [Adiantum nelumboides]
MVGVLDMCEDMKTDREKKVALIAGVTGMVGASLAKLLLKNDAGSFSWKVYGVSRHRVPTWMQEPPFHHICCDLLDCHQAMANLSPLSDVTHIFFVTWTSRDTEQENCVTNTTMLKNLLEPLLKSCKNLQHVCLQTGIKHYIGSHVRFASITSPMYIESANRLSDLNFYYAQEDYLFDVLGSYPREHNVSWSIHRPGLIFGLSTSSFVNVVYALGVYASICKHEKTPLAFIGTETTWESHLNASDANLIAEQQIWAATHTEVHNQAFNVSNGDDHTWKEIWVVLAQSFGIDYEPCLQQPQTFVELMKGKIQVWEDIVHLYGLFHTRLENYFMGWHILDVVFQKMPTGKSSMQKSQSSGFHNARDTKQSLLYWIDKMRKAKLVL